MVSHCLQKANHHSGMELCSIKLFDVDSYDLRLDELPSCFCISRTVNTDIDLSKTLSAPFVINHPAI